MGKIKETIKTGFKVGIVTGTIMTLSVVVYKEKRLIKEQKESLDCLEHEVKTLNTRIRNLEEDSDGLQEAVTDTIKDTMTEKIELLKVDIIDIVREAVTDIDDINERLDKLEYIVNKAAETAANDMGISKEKVEEVIKNQKGA